ncbi:TraR/DksA C4-type zinc finger protein [Actinomadura madurae]|uniref:TraR/DksA family transcriptional regulator n=2 Tax=Actinomadura madurae TaxID=1993 RepID=UPI002025FA9E|nr:TraR/DksA C4-type zinc finger protein [Actinomadura madurae]URM99359.1 TraR/DksA C4-type zinc finger protein [Actinomadura madurae]
MGVRDEMTTAKERLIADRDDTVKLIASLSGDWDGLVEASTQTGVDDEHDPEGATIAFERARIDASLSRARTHLTDIDDALRRLDKGTYGICEQCGAPIAAERLTARPATRTCFACAS